MGCSSTLAFVIGSAFRALVTAEESPSLVHWMLPGPSHHPHVAEEDDPRDHPVAHRSAPPEGLEVIKPLMEDEQRYDELEDRLNRHFFGNSEKINGIAYDDLVEKQLLIEKKIEKELLHDEYSRDRIYANRYDIRECEPEPGRMFSLPDPDPEVRSRFGRAAEWIDSGAEVLLAVLLTKTSSHAMRSRLPVRVRIQAIAPEEFPVESYCYSNWMKRSLQNEVSLTVQEFRKALSTGRGFDFLEGDKLPRSLYVWVSLIEDRKKTEEMAERVRALVPQTLRLR
ncbi:hypothetical protein R6Q57_018608 [Mikania cordata]